MKKSCLVTGSFDPFTIGHLDIAIRAAKIFDTVYIAILNNPYKKCFFTVEERIAIAQKAVENNKKIEVVSFDGMTVELAKKLKVNYLVRGIRNDADYTYEYEMADYNSQNGKVETVCYFTDKKYNAVSSTEVRKNLAIGESIKNMVAPNTVAFIEELYRGRLK